MSVMGIRDRLYSTGRFAAINLRHTVKHNKENIKKHIHTNTNNNPILKYLRYKALTKGNRQIYEAQPKMLVAQLHESEYRY